MRGHSAESPRDRDVNGNTGPRRRAGPSTTALSAAATTTTAIGLAVILGLAVGTVGRADEDAATNAAHMAADLWELSGGGDAAVTAFLGGRATIETLPRDDAGVLPGAYAYRAGDLEPTAWIQVVPAERGRGWPFLPTSLALLGLAFMSAWAVARRRYRPPSRHPALVALPATVLLAATAASAAAWAHRALDGVSTERAAQGARAVEVALAHGADPGHAPHVAGLPWATTGELERSTELWTMPRDVAAAVATAPAPPPEATTYTVNVAGATYHVAHTRIPTTSGPGTPATATSTRLHLALLGYGATHSPAIPLAAAATASALATTLILFLLSLSTRPRTLRRTLTAWGFLAPAAVLLLLFTFGPLLYSLWISLHEWHLVDPVHPFTGIDNYISLILDGEWWSAIRNTAVFTLHVPFAMAVALGLALLTRGSRRMVRWARLALFLPGITSVVAIAVVWKWLLDDGYGLVNRALEQVGFDSVPWLTSPDTALVTLMAISVWMVVGYQMVVFQAGLAAIPRDWYDAARVDGAGPLQRFRHITLPGLRHTLFFVLVTSVIGSFQVFGLVYVMTEGGPLGATDVAVYHIYREAWEFLRFGNAAAMSWILFAVVFAATWLHFRLLERRGAHA